MAWIYLLIAGILEIVWAVALKFSAGFTRWGPGAVVVVAGVLSIYTLSLAVRALPMGTAYAIWTGIGAAGTAIIGILVFGESHAPLRLLSIGFILAGIAGLRLTA